MGIEPCPTAYTLGTLPTEPFYTIINSKIYNSPKIVKLFKPSFSFFLDTLKTIVNIINKAWIRHNQGTHHQSV